MIFKPCPFCMNAPEVYVDDNRQYVIECPHCKKLGFSVRFVGDDPIKTKLKWNSRAYDTFLTNNKDKVIEAIDRYNSGSHPIDDDFEFNTLYNGCYILPDGVVLDCKDNHLNLLMDYLGIDKVDKDFLDTERMIDFRVVRISMHDKCMAIAFNLSKVSKKQLELTVKEVISHYSINYLKYYLFIKTDDGKQVEEVYDNFSKLLLKLDEVEKLK